MTGKEKARSSAATLKRAAEMGAFGEAPISFDYHSTSAEDRQIKISDYLAHGAESAVPRRHLRQMTGLSDRELRRRIQEERLAGVPILSSNDAGGYFLPADESELEHFVRSMRSRAREVETVAAAVEEADIDWT